jgi:hypothetical protein
MRGIRPRRALNCWICELREAGYSMTWCSARLLWGRCVAAPAVAAHATMNGLIAVWVLFLQ